MKAQPKSKLQDADEFMRQCEHPLRSEIDAVRRLIRGADPAIAEGIKWNAPSFRVNEYFATVNLRSHDAVQVIVHLGAKVRAGLKDHVSISDTHGLLRWLGHDRASIKFCDINEIKTHGHALQELVRQWITHLKAGVTPS